MPEYDFTNTYVDDDSKDHMMGEIKKVVASAEAGRVQYISLLRNFGKKSAIYPGLSKCTSDYVALLDRPTASAGIVEGDACSD